MTSLPASAGGPASQRAATAQQRARLNGGDIIKTYVHESDRRREYSRYIANAVLSAALVLRRAECAAL